MLTDWVSFVKQLSSTMIISFLTDFIHFLYIPHLNPFQIDTLQRQTLCLLPVVLGMVRQGPLQHRAIVGCQTGEHGKTIS